MTRVYDRARFRPGVSLIRALLIAALAVHAGAGADEVSPLERGRLLFERGQGLDPVAARLAGDFEVDGSSMPCASCHGNDGIGREESGFVPTRLHWPQLTRPYDITTPSGRVHGPYSPGLFKRAVTLGLDPAGNTLHNIMPRYRMSLRDLDNLTAYIQTLDGVTDGPIRIGMPRFASDHAREFEQATLSTVRAMFADINAAGGRYGRRLELVELPIAASADAAAVTQLLDRERPIALLGGVLPAGQADAREALLAALRRHGLPWIGPLAASAARSEQVFHLEAGLITQAEALTQWALEHASPEADWRIVVGPGDGLEEAASAAAARLNAAGKSVRQLTATRADTARAADDAGEAVTLLLAAPTDAERWLPRPPYTGLWIQPVALTSPAIVEALGPRLRLAAPIWPLPQQLPVWDELMRLTETHALGRDHSSARMSAIAAARVLIAVLERTGRSPSAESLLDQLERLREFDAGLGRPISFGPLQREANPGAFVFSPELSAPPHWQAAR
ncbi:MAG: ABC transporter substrate-binding protein [Wenzhouxiangellaceae bacterium]